MKAQINTLNSGCILVSLYNTKRIVDQKYFKTDRKAINYCNKYGFEITAMNEAIDDLNQVFPCPRQLLKTSANYAEFKKSSPEIAALIEWIASSKEAFIVRIPKNKQQALLGSTCQVRFILQRC